MEPEIEMTSLEGKAEPKTDAKVVADTANVPSKIRRSGSTMRLTVEHVPRSFVVQQTKIKQRKSTQEQSLQMSLHFKKYLENRERFLIRPSYLCKKVWDTVLLVVTTVLLVLVPIHWSFFSTALLPCVDDGDSFPAVAQSQFKTMQQVSISIISVCSLLLVIDICMTFFTPFFDNYLSFEVVRLDRIAWHYLRYSFWIDAMAAFPWTLCYYRSVQNVVELNCDTEQTAYNAEAAMQWKLSEIVMLLPWPFLEHRFSKELRGCATYLHVHFETFEFMHATSRLMLLLNLMACIWNYIGEVGDNSALVQTSWSSNYLGGMNTMRYNGINGFMMYYLSSFYYASMTCTTIGYGDVTAQTTVERVCSSIFMIIGAAFYGYFVGITVTVVESRGAANKEYFQGVDTMNELMRIRKTPKNVSRAIRNFLDHSRSLREEKERAKFMRNLSPVLRARMCECMYGDSIRKIRCFKYVSREFVGQLGAALQPQAFSANETLIRRNEISGKVFSQGSCQ